MCTGNNLLRRRKDEPEARARRKEGRKEPEISQQCQGRFAEVRGCKEIGGEGGRISRILLLVARTRRRTNERRVNPRRIQSSVRRSVGPATVSEWVPSESVKCQIGFTGTPLAAAGGAAVWYLWCENIVEVMIGWGSFIWLLCLGRR